MIRLKQLTAKAVMAAVMLYTAAAAQGPWTSGSTEATLSGGTLTIRGTGPMADYSTNSPWYGERASIVNVVIEEGVTSIGNRAFLNMGLMYSAALTTVTIPNSVTSIGNNAFYNCNGIASITIPGNVTSIGADAFRNSGLTTVIIPNSVTSIGNNAFRDCINLTAVTLSQNLTSIGNSMFEACSLLTSITIPSSVTTIGTSVFRNCKSLASITIPNSVTSIGSEAFRGSGLTSVTIPDGVTIIENSLFLSCSLLTTVTIHNSVTSIGNNAFNNCKSLTSIIIPNSVISIGNGAFSSCVSLASATIGSSVASIGNQVFMSCTSLAYIEVASGNTNFNSENGVLFSNNNDKTILRIYPAGKQDAVYAIPSGIDSIGDYAFQGAKISTLIIPSSIMAVGFAPFDGNRNLTSIISQNPVPPAIGAVFGHGAAQNIGLYVPQGSIEAYRSQWETDWDKFKYIKHFFTVTFDSQEGSAVSPQPVGEGNKLTKPDNPARSGYTFAGWYYNKNGECNGFGFICQPTSLDEWDFNNDIVTKDVTLYAMWESSSSVFTSPRANSSITPSVSVRGRMLNVKLPSSLQAANLQIRMIDMRGRTVSNFKITNGIHNSFSLAKIPAGRYIVEVRNAGKRVNSTPVVIR